jgi:phosphohistidine phosphatase
MGKQLILLRHAETMEKQVGQQDKDRELTARGIVQSTQAGTYMQENKVTIDAIFSSSAIRTNMTTAIVADAIQCDAKKISYHDELYEATPRTFLQFINAISDDHQSVMCVGHNPAITYLAEYLTKADVGEMSPGSFVIMTTTSGQWSTLGEGTATFVKHIYPRMLERQ